MKRIEFKPPAGVVPEGMESGSTFEEVSTFRVKSNGDICLIAIGEAQMPGYSDKDGKGNKVMEAAEKMDERYA